MIYVAQKNKRKKKKRITFNKCDFFSSKDLNVLWYHTEAEEGLKLAAAKWLFSVNASLL